MSHCNRLFVLAACTCVLSNCDGEVNSRDSHPERSNLDSRNVTEQPTEPISAEQQPAAEAPIVDPQRIAISCTKAGDPYTEIYIIDEEQRKFFFYNQGSQAIEPACSGDTECNWEYTENRISFEDPDNGFVIAQTLNRVSGELTSRLAIGDTQFTTRLCERTAMPSIAANRF